MWIRLTAYFIFTVIAGNAIAAGYIAFITLLGIYDKLLVKLYAIRLTYIIEWLIIFGGLTGTVIFLFNLQLPFKTVGLFLFNLFGGTFTGCLAGALAEILKIFPVISRRFKIRKGMPYILFAAALGKAVGCYINLY